jgi:hypothetical protein
MSAAAAPESRPSSETISPMYELVVRKPIPNIYTLEDGDSYIDKKISIYLILETKDPRFNHFSYKLPSGENFCAYYVEELDTLILYNHTSESYFFPGIRDSTGFRITSIKHLDSSLKVFTNKTNDITKLESKDKSSQFFRGNLTDSFKFKLLNLKIYKYKPNHSLDLFFQHASKCGFVKITSDCVKDAHPKRMIGWAEMI